MRNRLVSKAPDVDQDRLGDELILMQLRTLEVRVLNDVGAILWEALDAFGTEDELVGLLVEARPESEPPVHRAHVADFLAGLEQGGYLQLQPIGE
jgi:hypothetical protein